MNDTNLKTLMNFLRENEGLLFYCKEKNCFALVTNHYLSDSVLVPTGSTQCSFCPPDGDMGDIGNNFLGPAIHAIERFGDGV